MVMLENGAARRFVVSGGTVVQSGIEPATLEAEAPPLLAVVGGGPKMPSVPVGDASPLTHPVPLGDEARMAYMAINGDLSSSGRMRRWRGCSSERSQTHGSLWARRDVCWY